MVLNTSPILILVSLIDTQSNALYVIVVLHELLPLFVTKESDGIHRRGYRSRQPRHQHWCHQVSLFSVLKAYVSRTYGPHGSHGGGLIPELFLYEDMAIWREVLLEVC